MTSHQNYSETYRDWNEMISCQQWCFYFCGMWAKVLGHSGEVKTTHDRLILLLSAICVVSVQHLRPVEGGGSGRVGWEWQQTLSHHQAHPILASFANRGRHLVLRVTRVRNEEFPAHSIRAPSQALVRRGEFVPLVSSRGLSLQKRRAWRFGGMLWIIWTVWNWKRLNRCRKMEGGSQFS